MNNNELKPKWINNKVKRCQPKKKTYYLKYLFYLRHNYTTDGVTCEKHYEEYVKHKTLLTLKREKKENSMK